MSSHKVGVYGVCGVGKTALTIQLCSNHFVEDYDPTIEDSYRKRCVIDGIPCLLEILDSVGAEDYEYSPLRRQWMTDCQGFLLMYSITSKKSFDKVNGVRQILLEEVGKENVPILLVGNKIDLEDCREVTVEEEEELAKLFNYKLWHTSAKTRQNVEEVFYDLIREIRARSTPDHVPYTRNSK